jgi:hypothetical protein
VTGSKFDICNHVLSCGASKPSQHFTKTVSGAKQVVLDLSCTGNVSQPFQVIVTYPRFTCQSLHDETLAKEASFSQYWVF